MAGPPALADELRRTLARLAGLSALEPYYLVGGTALGLQLGHRVSRDLDFFSRKGDAELDRLKLALAARFDVVDVRAQTDAAVHFLCDGVPVDFVCYPYALLEPTRLLHGVATATLRDLGPMKLAAIARRGIKRDFWDLYAIIQDGLPLAELLGLYRQKFGTAEADTYHVLRGLTYFADAEADPVEPAGLTPEGWAAIKAFFAHEAPAVLSLR